MTNKKKADATNVYPRKIKSVRLREDAPIGDGYLMTRNIVNGSTYVDNKSLIELLWVQDGVEVQIAGCTNLIPVSNIASIYWE